MDARGIDSIRVRIARLPGDQQQRLLRQLDACAQTRSGTAWARLERALALAESFSARGLMTRGG